jgi:flavin reductase (DIM6/NTAB) family NADH-FMN oxidoreductase RutF
MISTAAKPVFEEPPAPVALDFRMAMRRLASTVCITTTQTPDGPIGMTMTSVTSVSMSPPTLLICVHRSTRLADVLRVGATFCVNLLNASQHPTASAFGGGVAAADRFSVGMWNVEDTAAPCLEDAQANIFCRVEGAAGVGTHIVIVGCVEEVRLFGEPAPLIYSDGRYTALGAGVVGF